MALVDTLGMPLVCDDGAEHSLARVRVIRCSAGCHNAELWACSRCGGLLVRALDSNAERALRKAFDLPAEDAAISPRNLN